MDSDQAKAQIKQMVDFIMLEAQEKSQELETKGQEEFNIEKFRIVNREKEKIRSKYAIDAKKVETKCAIERSSAINKSRLEKIKKRSEMLNKVSDEAKIVLKKEASNAKFIQSLIVQASLQLLEEEVSVRCRKSDEAVVQGCLSAASAEYAKIIQAETGAKKTLKLSVDKTKYLDEKLTGGVQLACQNDSITIDNTIDVRLSLVLENDKPAIRSLMFPV